jgi:CheY-like chemotaxis protein
MNAIVGFIHLALQTDLDPELREQLDTVRTSADWLMHIANDALEFSSIEDSGLPLDHMPFSISECILAAMKIVEREASVKKLVTGCKIDPKLPEMVCGDPIRLQHAIFNLLNYAVGFSESGSIILSAALESDSVDSVLVRVAITDTGVDIPAANRALLFEPISHADVGAALKSDPAGFGLVISRRLVDRMGGTMESPAQLGSRSTFEFTVRLQKQKTKVEIDAAIRAPEGVALKSLSILIAEDSAVNRRLITKVLESAGHRVWTATNGKEAAHKVRTEGFDLILMDLEMPGMDGLEATRTIRAAEAPNLRVPIYALTAHALPHDRENCFAAGMDGFVGKPIVVDEVLQLVSQIARQPSGAFTPKYVEREITIASDTADASDIAEPGTDCGDSATDAGEGSSEPCIPQADATPSTDLLSGEEEQYFDSSAYLLARSAAGTETNGFSGATGASLKTEIDEAGDVAIDTHEDPAGADSDDADSDRNVLQEMQQSHTPLSAAAGLALLGAACQVTESSPPPVKQADDPAPAAARDPFEQARKSLSKSSFGIRVVHNDGDPSDRNLI